MITIFQGRQLSLDGTEDQIYATVAVALRDCLFEFHNGKNLNPFGVFLKIALHADADGWAWPGRANISRGTGISTSQALSSALKHLRNMTIEGHRVLAMYRELDPDTHQWGRTCYRIFPDAFPDGMASAPEHLRFLVEYKGKAPKEEAAAGPIYDNRTLDPQPQDDGLIHDDPQVGDPYTADPYTGDPPEKENHSEETPGRRKTSIEEIASDESDAPSLLDAAFPREADENRKPAEPLSPDRLAAAAMGLTATPEGARIAAGTEADDPNQAAAYPWSDAWAMATRRTPNRLDMATYDAFLARFALWEPAIVIPTRDASTIRGWAKAIRACLVPFFEAWNADGYPIDQGAVRRLAIAGLDLFYTQKELGEHRWNVASPFSLQNAMRKIAGELRALQVAQGLDHDQPPSITTDNALGEPQPPGADEDLLREGQAMSARIAQTV